MTPRRSRLLSFGFLALLAILVGAGYVVAQMAQSAVLASRSGSISEYSLDPDEPGFRAFTESTSTALVLHTAVVPGTGAELVGATLLTAAGDDAGGTIVTIPHTFTDSSGQDTPLSELFRRQGLDAVTAELRTSLGIGFADVVVLDASSWTTLMTADLPLTLTLRDDLVESSSDGSTSRIVLAAGTRPYELSEIARIASHENPGEPALGVALRHQQVWQSWISRTAGEEERPAIFELQTGFIDLINTLANAEVSYRVIPTTTSSAANSQDTRYVARRNAVDDLMSMIVPFPEQAEPGDRVSVLLLDTSFGEVDQAPVVTAITRAGGLVTILGNSQAGAERTTEIQLHDAAASEVAQAIADALGAPSPRSVPLDDATTAITVTIG